MKKVLELLLLILMICNLTACNARLSIKKIDDYDSIMSDNTNDPKPDDDPKKDVAPEYEGFLSIGGVYDRAEDFFGNYAYAERDTQAFFVDANGKESLTPKLNSIAFKDDRFILSADDSLTLKHVSKGVLIQGSYDRIDYSGSTALAFKDGLCKVYRDAQKISEISRTDVSIIAENAIKIGADDIRIYNLDLTPIKIGTYYVAYPQENGPTLIIDQQTGLFGYALSDGTVIRGPQYVLAEVFHNGFGIAMSFAQGKLQYHILDENGERHRSDIKPFPFNDDYFVTKSPAGEYALMNRDFEIVDIPSTIVPLHNRVYNGYIIDADTNRIYSLKKREFIEMGYTRILALENTDFICANADGTFDLRDKNFRLIIANKSLISFAHGIYRFSEGGKYFYKLRL